ncbi:FAD assembly factor SdhE [Candidatus Vondammii sp. HM_W22]|uniref:FAD assembly factor SdhE n=1 Tax=Candidatus Vondammii sp. HM_W22 TaxID=2687299 RepID=UPI001F13B4D2|nr:succinate dehydrogenase assembly factor 2 [Candidatus Vondammii sp. HM_W22]
MSLQTQLPSMDKLRWQCRRGMLELDYVLRGFLEDTYPGLSQNDRALFVQVLDFEDQLLLDWLMGNVVSSDAGIRRLIGQMRHS